MISVYFCSLTCALVGRSEFSSSCFTFASSSPIVLMYYWTSVGSGCFLCWSFLTSSSSYLMMSYWFLIWIAYSMIFFSPPFALCTSDDI